MKTALIRQPAGLGDIFWLQPLIDDMHERGFHVIYPVCDHYYDMMKTSVKTKHSNFIRESELEGRLLEVYGKTDYVIEDDFEYYPFDCISHPKYNSFRPEYARKNIMVGKYMFYKEFNPDFDIDVADWRKSVTIIRNFEREKKYQDLLELGDEFVWVNRAFGTPPGIVIRDMNLPENLLVVENDSRLTNVFDVCGVLEKAKEIHTVETCFCYIAELLDLTAELNLYSRKINGQNQHKDFSYVDIVYKKDWIKHL
jgi:hypothetical protein